MRKIKIFYIILYFCFIFSAPAFSYDQDALNYNNIGISHTKKGNYEQALNYFKKAVEIDPSLINAYYNMGSVYKHTGNRDKAVKSFQLLLRSNPNDDEAAYLLAGLYFEQQDYEKSLIYLNSIEKTSAFYKQSIELFKKINQKIDDLVIDEPLKSAPLNSSKFVYTNFSGPAGVSTDSSGNLYVANFLADCIQVLSHDGKLVSTIKNELIKGPVGIAIDSKDNIYAANYTSNNVIKISKNGSVKVILSNIAKPYYLYIDRGGVLYLSEQDKNTVIRVGVPE